MPLTCSSYGCTNRAPKLKENGEKVRFHLFPLQDKERLNKWLSNMKRASWKPSVYSRICSDHFSDACYKTTMRYVLKNDAIPTIFSFPPHLQKTTKSRRSIVKHKLPTKRSRKETSSVESRMGSCPVKDKPVPSLDMPMTTEDQMDNAGCSLDTSTTSLDTSMTIEDQVDNAGCSRVKDKPIKMSPTKAKLRYKIKLLQQKLRRRDRKITDLKSLLDVAIKRDMSSDSASKMQETFGGMPLEILTNTLNNQERKKNGRRYTPVMKEFALTLYFYSPRAYVFLRKKIILPHPAQIRSWVSTVNCEPGFLKESYDYIKDMITVGALCDTEFALIIDSMSIRKQVIWDEKNKKYAGYVECCGIIDGEDQCLASEALVFLIVSLKKPIKIPVSYFFVNKINSTVLSELIKTCLIKLHDVGATVVSVTGDAISSNVAAFEALGCRLSSCTTADDFKTFFPHPSSNQPVYVIFDPCHMLKLARNLLADKKVLTSLSGKIMWDFFKSLNVLQECIGLKFANKLSGAHINYHNKKMNVALAAQTFSSGVADAMEYLMKSRNIQFQGAEATLEFVRIVNKIFDLLNSRNPFSKSFKSPLSLASKEWWDDIFKNAISYLLELKLYGVQLVRTQRKMFAVGFITSIISISAITCDLLSKAQNPFKYVLTYKFSQDHIELFFNSIRACGGYNNNPNVCQFKWSLRKLLLAGNISTRNSNVANNNVEIPSILEFRSQKRALCEPATLSDDEQMILSMQVEFLNSTNLSCYQNNILYYIGGYLVKSLLSKLSCDACIEMLLSIPTFHNNNSTLSSRDPDSFTSFVSRGGLKTCSSPVFKIICAAEKSFKLLSNCNELSSKNINTKIRLMAIEYLSTEKVKFNHPIENEIAIEDLHETQITNMILNMYITLRLKTYGSKLTLLKTHKNVASVRQKLAKLILFKNV